MLLPSFLRRCRAHWRTAFATLLLGVLACNFTNPRHARADVPANPSPDKTNAADFKIDARQTLTYLASDELEGRGVGTIGLDKAADRISDDFHKLGLEPVRGFSNYFQPFKMTTAVVPDPKTSLAMGDTTYKMGKDFIPLSFSDQGSFDGNVVFVGYGIEKQEV